MKDLMQFNVVIAVVPIYNPKGKKKVEYIIDYFNKSDYRPITGKGIFLIESNWADRENYFKVSVVAKDREEAIELLAKENRRRKPFHFDI